MFVLASARSILSDPKARPRFPGQAALLAGQTAVFITEIWYAVVLIRIPDDHNAVDTIGNVLVASTLIGIYRAWEFVGDRATGIWSSIAVLVTGRARTLNVPDEVAESGDQRGLG